MDIKKGLSRMKDDFISRLKDASMVTLVIVALAVIVGFCAHMITKTNDSPVEQVAEEVIDYELGLPAGTVDFSKGDKKTNGK